MKDLRLPELPAKLAWPPPAPPLAAQFAASMIRPPHLGANWHQEAERTRALREEHERAIAHYSGNGPAARRARGGGG